MQNNNNKKVISKDSIYNNMPISQLVNIARHYNMRIELNKNNVLIFNNCLNRCLSKEKPLSNGFNLSEMDIISI